MRPLISLILLFGLYSESKAQIDLVFPCLQQDFYDIGYNEPLSLSNYNLIFELDRELFINNLNPERCFFYSLPQSSIITFQLEDRDRSYIYQNNERLRVFDYYPRQTIIIYEQNKTKQK